MKLAERSHKQTIGAGIVVGPRSFILFCQHFVIQTIQLWKVWDLSLTPFDVDDDDNDDDDDDDEACCKPLMITIYYYAFLSSFPSCYYWWCFYWYL